MSESEAPHPVGCQLTDFQREKEEAVTSHSHPRTKNLALRRVRQSMRLSQAEFAEALRAAGNAVGEPNGCTKRLVQKWENGEHSTCRASYAVVLQAVTGLPASELGLRTFPSLRDASTARLGDAAPGEGGEGGEVSGGPGSLPDGPAALRVLALYDDALVRESMERLRHALNHPSTVDARAAEFVETATARLYDLERHSPARLLGRSVDRHLAMVTSLLTAARPERLRRRLMISAGHTALLAGWLAFDRGDVPSSQEFWAAAIGAAQGAADDGLFAAALIHQSYAAARRGDPSAAWQLAHSAAARAHHDARASAWISARVALYAAQLGESKAAESAMLRSLEIGLHLASPTPGDPTLPWTCSFDRARLLSSTAWTAALLNDPRAADYAAEAVEALVPAKVKSRAVVLAEATLASAIVGDFELCLDYGSTAAALARDMDVSIAVDLLTEVVPLVLPRAAASPVRELLPYLTDLSRSATYA